MQIGCDAAGKVWLIGDAVPTDWNDQTLTVHELTPEQEKAFAVLPDRSETSFDGSAFTYAAPALPVVSLVRPSVQEQLDALWSGGDAMEAMRKKMISTTEAA